MRHYVLGGEDGRVAIWEPDLLVWARWMEAAWDARVVGRTPVGDWEVSTVFLGADHALPGAPGPRRLFETMIFNRGDRQATRFCARYATWAEAAAGHAAVVEWLEAAEA